MRKQPGAGRKTPGYSLIGNARQGGRTYTRFVGGDAFGQGQAKIHQGRWTLVRDAVEEEVEALPPEIEREIGMVARRLGFG